MPLVRPRLVLYSGGSALQNRRLDEELLSLPNKRRDRIRMTFIPSSSERLREQFAEFFGDFKRFGVRSTFCLPVDAPLAAKELEYALKSDIIYMGGGNSFYFLQQLRRRRLLPKLRDYARTGGVLAGLSAGAILLCPSIIMAKIPKQTADHNEVGLEDLQALKLVPFDFHAHYARRRWENAELIRYSRRIAHPVYACADGNGIVVEGNELRFIGEAHAFLDGKHFVELDSWSGALHKAG